MAPKDGTPGSVGLVEDNLALVPFFMSRLHMFGDPDDLEQAGRIGLMMAADKFDDSQGWQFSTYAAAWIKNAIRRESDKQRSPGTSHKAFLAARLRNTTVADLEGKLQRHPTRDEIVEVVGEKIADARVVKTFSVDAPPKHLELPEYEGEWLGVEDTAPELFDDLQQLDYLEDHERRLLVAHGMGFSHTEIAEVTGVLPETVGIRLKKLKARLLVEIDHG